MNLGLQEKVIIVSGGARGIGQAVVQILASEGAIPIILGKDEADNLAVVSEIESYGYKCDAFTAELTEPSQCESAVKYVGEKYGRIDGLVNNAGLNDGIGIETGTYEDFITSYHRNAVHYFLLAHHALPYLKQSSGAIVNVSSKVAETGQGGTSAYAAANGARNALTREWAVDLAKYNIRSNAVIVAECYTHMYKNWIAGMPNPEQKLAEITSRIPLGNRMTTPEEIANMVAFLLSNVSSHTTGQLIHVDGGYTHLDRRM